MASKLMSNTPTHQTLVCWFYLKYLMVSIALLTYISASEAMSLKAIEKQIDYYTNMKILGIQFNWNRSKYLTVSAESGKELFVSTGKPEVFFSSHGDNISLNLLTYPEFEALAKQLKPKFKHFKVLPKLIDKYMSLIEIEPLKLSINYILIANDDKIFEVSSWHPISKNVELTFYDNVKSDQIEDYSLYVERPMIDTFSHELFHFFIGYQNQYRLKTVRSEVYAHLFGKCVAYEIYPEIGYGMDQMEFTKDDFIDPSKDLKALRKKMKGETYFKSRIAEGLAFYYFQAVAKNYTGENISSDDIPKFCHKLFSEHNFKHPIEKKPPPWFKEFLQED